MPRDFKSCSRSEAEREEVREDAIFSLRFAKMDVELLRLLSPMLEDAFLNLVLDIGKIIL
jgi:hypothetical protein